MTKEEFAAGLDGVVSYGNELDDYARKTAKENGLVVVYGASDDLMEIDGAIRDEADVYEGGVVYLNSEGVLSCPDCEEWRKCPYYLREREKAKWIAAVWCPEDSAASWKYNTEIPHATFRVVEDGELYCIGIVFSEEDLKYCVVYG